MSRNNISLELRKQFPPAEWSWLLLALRQDDTVWGAFEKTDLGERALKMLPVKAEAWSPAALSLLALESPIELETLRSTPLQPLEEGLFQQASRIYEGWSKNQLSPESLAEAGLLALTFREQFRVSRSWRETLRSVEKAPLASKTPLACLYGMLPESQGLLGALVQEKGSVWVELAIHVLLSNPNPPEVQLSALKNLPGEIEPARILDLVQALASSRPFLGTLLARQVLNSQPKSSKSAKAKSASKETVGQLEQLIQTMRMAQIHQLAGQADMAVPALADSLRIMRRLRGHLSAELAHTVAQTKDVMAEGWGETAREASVEAWKQAVLLAPDEPRFAAGYASALLTAGRVTDAGAYLNSYIKEESHPLDSLLMLNYALVLDRLKETPRARQAALKSLELMLGGGLLTEHEAVLLTASLLKNHDLKEAHEAAVAALEKYPASRDLLGLFAKIKFALGQPAEAASAAYAAQAVAAYQLNLAEKEPQQFIILDEIGQSVESPEFNLLDIQRLLVDSLEALGDWEAAYHERLSMLDDKAEPSTVDLKALACCAAGAKKYEKVIEISRKLLKDEPGDITLHHQLAVAAEAIHDFDTAIQHFQQAIQLAPDYGECWKGLVSAHKSAGDEEAAFETLRAASQALPTDAAIQIQLGEHYLSQGSPTLALPCFRRAASAVGTSSRSWDTAIRLGETLYQLGRLEDARQVLEPVYGELLDSNGSSIQSGEENNPKTSPELMYIYARTLLGLGEPEKAVPILTQVMRDNPSDPRLCLDLAKALMQLSEQASGARRAIPFLQRLLDVSPDGSESGYSSAVEAVPGLRGEACAILADAYAAVGEWEMAMDAYRKALEEPANQETSIQTRLSMGLGLTALKLELPEMAVAALQEAAHVEPLNGQLQRSLCEAYLANGLAQDAYQAARTALELAPADMDMLVWFIEQGSRIAELPGIPQESVYAETIQALRSALLQAPDRADLLIHLGRVLLQTGSRVEALEVYRKLVAMDMAAQRVSPWELYQAARTIIEAGEARIAVSLLRKAIDQLEGKNISAEPHTDGLTLVDIYEVLVKALEQLGDLDGALEAIDHTLELDKARIALHIIKADLLFKLGRNEEAREFLMPALQRWPEHAGLRYRMARTLRELGDLSAALQQVELGIAALEDKEDSLEVFELYHLASRLAHATLRPRRAFAYLLKAIPETDPKFTFYENAVLRAELALEAGELQSASQAVSLFDDQSAGTPRAMAVYGREQCRRGNRVEGGRKCRSAVNLWIKLQMGGQRQVPATSKEEFLAELSAMGLAALENRLWAEAKSIFQQMVEMFPKEPQAHFKLAQALLICAESEAVCQDFEVVAHAPGADMLEDAALKKFEECLRSAAVLAGCTDILQPDKILENWDVEIKRSLGLCARRGYAVYIPTLEHAAALEYILQTIMPDIEDVSSLIMAYRRCGARDRALKSVQVGWHPVFENDDYRSDPQVIAQLALAEADTNQAVELVLGSNHNTNTTGSGWPEPPMMQFLLAKLKLQADDLHAASEALQQALAIWPEEPRWQAMAAKIHLAQPSDNRLQQLAEAVGYLARAAAQEPENGAHPLALGQIYLENGQIEQAIQSLEQATHLNPKEPEGWLALAKAQHLSGDLDRAAVSSERAIDGFEDPVDALLLRAEIALQTSNFRGALSRAQTVLRAHPDHPPALYILSRALEGLNRPAEALAAIEQALPLFENPLPMQLARLQLIKRANGLEDGLKALQALVAQNPKQAAYLALLADWLLEAGKQDAAVQAARLALQEGLEGLTFTQRADLHTMIGLHMRRAGQLDQAIHHLSEAIAQSSDHLDAYLELGRVYQDRREYQQALKVYQKAINMAGGDYRPYHQAGLVLKDSKDYMASEAMLRRAAQLAPNEVAVHRLLGAVVALNLVHSHRLIPGDAKGN